MSYEEWEALLAERTAEVELRTPRPTILNTFTWPAHCGDYLVYHRRVDANDLDRLAPDGDGKRFLAARLLDENVDESFLDNIWNDRLQGFLRFYLWRCRHCGDYVLTCDSD